MEWIVKTPALVGIVFFVVGNAVSLAIGWKVVKELIDSYRLQVAQLTTERNDYKTNLHAERNEHQAAQIRIKELEARPDLTTLEKLVHSQTELMRAYGESIQAIGRSLEQHMKDDRLAFNKLLEKRT